MSDRLVDWIRSKEAEGYSSQQVYQYLIQQGYDPGEINSAIKEASFPTYDTSRPLPSAIAVPEPVIEKKEEIDGSPGRGIMIWIALIVIIAMVLGATFYFYDANISRFVTASGNNSTGNTTNIMENLTGNDFSTNDSGIPGQGESPTNITYESSIPTD